MSNNLLFYNTDGSIFNATILSDHKLGNLTAMGNWDSNWAQIAAFTDTVNPFLPLYKQSGDVYTMPITSRRGYGDVTGPFQWDQDWSLIVPFLVAGHSFLLLYKRATGQAYTMPVGPGPHLGTTTLLSDKWQHDWKHIVPFTIGNLSYLLFYSDTGAAYAFQMVFGSVSITPARVSRTPLLGTRYELGTWANDWAQIVAFAIDGNPYLLFCRSNGDAYTAPIQQPLALQLRLVLGNTTALEINWGSGLGPGISRLVSFTVTDFSFGIDRIAVNSQKAASDHADNDVVSFMWTVTSARTQQTTTGSKTVVVSPNDGYFAALHSGQTIDGPFATDPIQVQPTDVVTITAQINNLGSSKQIEQMAQAEKLTETLVADLSPLIGTIIGTAIGAGPVAGFQKGKEIGETAAWVFKSVGDLASALGIHFGPVNCNGEVLHKTWVYPAGEFAAAGAARAGDSQTFDGPGYDGCGHAPNTTITWSVRPGL